MTKLESIVEEASSLPPAEQNRLAAALQKRRVQDDKGAALKETRIEASASPTREENWSDYYPDTLHLT